jgi:hypothetical protein
LFNRYLKLAALCAGVAMTAVASATSVMAQTYPTQPIKILIGFGPGSAADVLARLVSKQMEASLGQPIVVENRPGNSSMIAAETVARASADGYTLFMATIANTLNPAETKSKFNLAKDLAPIALLGIVPNVLVAHPSVPANNLQELIALAKSKPESLTFGSSGYATASYMAAQLFNDKADTKIVTVPYQGGSNQALSDLLSGRITLMFNAALHHREIVGRLKRCAEERGRPQRAEAAGYRSGRRYAAGICRFYPRRYRKMGRGSCVARLGEVNQPIFPQLCCTAIPARAGKNIPTFHSVAKIDPLASRLC